MIPTFSRLAELRRVLDAVERERRSVSAETELVIVDDGSTDGTWGWLEKAAAQRSGWTVLRQQNAGPARARNRGVGVASGEIVLFLGDDTEPQPGWLEEHLEEHRFHAGGGPLAVLGYTCFPMSPDSPFLRHVNEHGAQFGYLLIERPDRVPFNFFYTSNISLPRGELVRLGGFREDFPAAAWEDIELAYRAVGEGLTIRYQPRARAIHHHRIRPRSFCRRQRTSGHSAAIFAGLHPELSHFLGVERVRAGEAGPTWRRWALAALVELGEWLPGVVPDGVRRRFLDACYLRGLAEGLGRSTGGSTAA